jgi:protein-S-isoprenylcysteine O-methyltransferase Ste14
MPTPRPSLRLLMHIPVPWVFLLTYLLGVVLEVACPLVSDAWKTLSWLRIAGFAWLCTGAALAGWGLVTFWRARTTTVPGRLSSQLVTWGPYRFTRNPMYVGLTTFYLGQAGILRQLWPVILLPLVLGYLNWVVIPVEEQKLLEVFGETYEQYRKRVRRWV